MGFSILAWSTFGGAIVGLIFGALVLGMALVIAELLPAPVGRGFERIRVVLMVAFLVGGPLVGAVLGFLEGRLKL